MNQTTTENTSKPLTASERILDAIRRQGVVGCTCEELETVLGLPHTTVSARVSELSGRNGRIVRLKASGFLRPTKSGHRATVWVIA